MRHDEVSGINSLTVPILVVLLCASALASVYIWGGCAPPPLAKDRGRFGVPPHPADSSSEQTTIQTGVDEFTGFETTRLNHNKTPHTTGPRVHFDAWGDPSMVAIVVVVVVDSEEAVSMERLDLLVDGWTCSSFPGEYRRDEDDPTRETLTVPIDRTMAAKMASASSIKMRITGPGIVIVRELS
ncbi:MAG: hypothetical protein AAFS10_05850, partial [Myxococcota bacterium]